MNSSFDFLDLSTMKDPDINNLVSHNQNLAVELAQCQADKDFVWSLWKKLQVSNPDVTEAISLVIQREKEKSEVKDRKVLEIIQVKDDRIEELQNIVAKQAQEISDGLAKKVELTEKNGRIQGDNDRLEEKVRILEVQVRCEENRERSLEDNFRKSVEGTEKEKYELNRKITRLTSELEVAKSEKAHAVNRQKILEERIKVLEKEVSEKMVRFEELVREVEDSTSRLSRYESHSSQLRRDLEFKNQELENVRKELKELWLAHNQLTEHSGQQADLIRQLQSLQQDTQKMLKNQEDAFTVESSSLQQMFTDVNSRYEAAKRTEADLRQQVLELKKSLMDKDDIISSLHTQEPGENGRVTDQSLSPGRGSRHQDYTGSFLDIVQEVDALSATNSSRTNQQKGRGRSLGRNLDSGGLISPSVDANRSRSLSPPTRERTFSDSRKIEELEKALQLKSSQVEELKRAHDSRLQRLQNLQASYRLAREEIKTYEFGNKPKGKKPKPKRADPRSLQKENSDQVWNELSFFKTENRSLHVDKMCLQEEVDLLRVQTSQDAAQIHELRVSVEAQRDEYEFQLRRVRREQRGAVDAENQVPVLKSQVHNKTVHIEKLERDMDSVISQREDLVQEKSKLMSQLVATQQEASQHRMELADVKHQLQSARHEMEEMKQRSPVATMSAEEEEEGAQLESGQSNSEVVNAVASRLMDRDRVKKKRRRGSLEKKYQSALNKGMEKIASLFTEEGWEEVPNSSDEEFESEATSLGDTIVTHSQGKPSKSISRFAVDKNGKKIIKPRRVPTSRPPNRKKAQSDESPSAKCQSPPRARSTHDHVQLREFATSPIAFLSASSSCSPRAQPPATFQTSATSTTTTARAEPLRTNTTTARPLRRTTADSRQLASLRQRVSHLQQQVSILKKAKMLAVHSEEMLKESLTKAQGELTSVSTRLKVSKQHAQKLQLDLEKLQKEKQDLETGARNKHDGRLETGADFPEMKVLEAKLKVATSEVSRQSASLRSAKTENDSLQEQVRSLQDRINHLERDVNQKRNLLESQRIKLKHAQDVNKTDANNVEELQTKIKMFADGNNKLKVQVESLRKRINLVMKEKKEYEDKFIKVSLDLDHKVKQLKEATSCRTGLESALSELEVSAQQQLHGLATQSEAAIDAAKDKLTIAQTRLAQFQSMVKILGAELISRTDRARTKMKEAKASQERCQREEDMSLMRAQDKARDILNLSHSDLEDIMSADGDRDSQDSIGGDDRKSDKRWLRKCEKLMNSKEDFVHPLISLLLQKMDERADLLIKMPRGI
ncbi:centlein [Aplysia californica]|uniref:Centlein n=1 Tax=Aplysia californica TaxID=6500 RepID=A0ABM0ZYX7_APLCA|nr:centlein [Aplysia californica]